MHRGAGRELALEAETTMGADVDANVAPILLQAELSPVDRALVKTCGAVGLSLLADDLLPPALGQRDK